MELTLQQKLDQQFASKHVPVTESGCWLWTGFVNRGGYGRFRVADKKMLAHRYAWIRNVGEVEAGQFVLHKCDTPSCVNPNHLFLGSKADNNADKVRKCRQSRGAAHSTIMRAVAAKGASSARTKLSDDQVRAIRLDHRGASEIARAYGVSPQCISGIKTGSRRQCVR